MKNSLDHATLKAKQRAIRAGFPETMGLRAHRAINWIGRAKACGEDDDARFLFIWITFNAAYADFHVKALSRLRAFHTKGRTRVEQLPAARKRCSAFWKFKPSSLFSVGRRSRILLILQIRMRYLAQSSAVQLN